jgi:vanillate O-demethylase ferredoxin subunit
MISAPQSVSAASGRAGLLLAAGIGITPLYAMALQLKAAGTPFTLHYYVRNRESAAFARELSGSVSASFIPPARAQRWQHLPVAESGLHAWICGPAGFMEKVREVATAKGWDDAHLHSEAFQPAPAAGGETGEIFTVKLASTGSAGRCLRIKPSPRCCRKMAWTVPLSCEMGICGACLTPVIDGVVDHRDSVQSEAEKGATDQQVALCCSRSHSGSW